MIAFRVRLAAVAAAAGFLVSAAHAQVSPGGVLLRTLPEDIRRDIDSAPNIDNLLGKRKTLSDIEGLKTEIKGFKVKGLTTFSERKADLVLKPFIGNDKTFQDILDAASALRRELSQQGMFLADVVIPEQEITSGTVELLVLEGRLGQVTVEYAPDVNISHSLIEGYLEPLRPGILMTTRKVERALYLVNDLRGINAAATFKPGAKSGTADLVVKVTATQTVTGYVDGDINGSDATGPERVGANLELNNLTGHGDVLSLRMVQSLGFIGDDWNVGSNGNRRNLSFARLGAVAPLGNTAVKGGISLSYLAYSLGGTNPAIVAIRPEGTAEIANGFLSYPFVRSRNLNVVGQYSLDHRLFIDLQPGIFREDQKSSWVNQFALNMDVRDSLLGGGISYFGLSYSVGNLDVKSPLLLQFDQAGPRTDGKYEKFAVFVNRLQQITDDWLLALSANAQFAKKNLDGSEKIVIAGPTGVRAFPSTQGVGDEGYVGTIEARRILPLKNFSGRLLGAAFYDFGWVQRNHRSGPFDPIANESSMSGIGLGFYLEVDKWAVRGSVAWRVTGNAPLPGGVEPDRNPRVFFQGSRSF